MTCGVMTMVKYEEPYQWLSFNQMKWDHQENLLLVIGLVETGDDDTGGGYLVAESGCPFDEELLELAKQYENKDGYVIHFTDVFDRMEGNAPFSEEEELSSI